MKRYRRPAEKKSPASRPAKFSRRGFIAGSATTIAAVAVTPTVILADPARATKSVGPAEAAKAADSQGLQPAESRTLVVLVRDLFPHDRLDDSFYLRAIAPLNDEATVDPAKRRLLAEGVANLDALAKAADRKPYAGIADENVRVAIIKKIEGTPFFTEVYGASIVALYNQPEVWPKFGYEGPSSAKGGYLHRGFNDIDWLPKS
jgi:hypothetical protein